MSQPALDRLVTELLDIRVWVALDIDDHGRVLAATDDLGSLQLVEIGPDGTRTELTDLGSRCTGRYVPGRRRVLVKHDSGGDELWQLSLLDLDGAAASGPVGPAALTPVVADPAHLNSMLDVTAGSVLYATNRRNEVDMDVVVRSHADGTERVVYDAGGYVVGTRVSHDEQSVAVVGLSLVANSTVVTVVGPDGVAREVTDRAELANHDLVGWSPDDRALILASDHGRDHLALQRLCLETGEWSVLVAAPDHDVQGFLSVDGSALLVCHHVDGLDRLAIHEVDGTLRCDVDVEPLSPVSATWSSDGSRIVVGAVTPTDPGRILAVDAATGATRVVLSGRDQIPATIRDALVTPTVHRVPAPDGESVPVFRYSAPEPTGAAVLHVHGGPEAEARRIFQPVIQALALSGFEVIVPNVRGSAGYGKRWYGLDDVDLRLDSVADLAAIHDWLPTVGLDPARAALWGGSYGGYMVLAGVSMQPGRWAAGVDIVGMSSLVTFLQNTSGYRRAFREREYGFLDRDMDLLVRASPITYLDQIRSPLFVIHGANDPRVPLSEAEQIKAALDGAGVDCELRVYSDEGHGLSKRVNRIDAYPAAIRFLRTHLLPGRPV